jgi:hypothetical protein
MSEDNKDLELDIDQDEDHGDDLKAKIAEDLGLDLDEHSDAIERAYQRELKQREMTSKAIQQKKKYRDQLEQFKKSEPTQKVDNLDSIDINLKIQEALDERDLKALSLPEELESEVKELAKFKKMSVTEVVKTPYIQSRKKELELEARINQGTPKRSNSGSYSKPLDVTTPPNRDDFSKDENGSKAYKEARNAHIEYLNRKAQ